MLELTMASCVGKGCKSLGFGNLGIRSSGLIFICVIKKENNSFKTTYKKKIGNNKKILKYTHFIMIEF